MVGSMAAFTFNDSCMKQVFGELPFFQAILIRSIFTVTFFAIVTWQTVRFRLNLNRGDWMLVGLRTLGEVGAAYFFLTALANMPIANVTAVLQVLPLSVTLAAAIFLREPVGWRRIGAIVLGGIGV
ncbi:MAG: DMT family transporter, partial [Pseudomonadota bacterium]